MFCEKCGSKIPDGSAFCPNCGSKAAAAAVKEVKQEVVQAAENAVEVQQQAVATVDQAAADAQAQVANVQAQVEAQAVAAQNAPAAPVKPPKQPKPKKEKTGKKVSAGLIIAIAILAVVLAVGAVFLFSKSARNAVKKAFSSDEDYFRSVEQNAVEDLVDMLCTAYDSDLMELLDFYESEFALNGDIDVKKDAEDLMEKILKATNKSLDLTWVNSGKLEADFAMKDGAVQLKGGITANKKTLFDFDLIADLNDAMAYIGLPLLNPEYAAIDLLDKIDPDQLLDRIDDFKALKDAVPTTKEIKKLVSKYTEIALKSIKKVSNVKKDVKLSVGNAKGEFTRYRVIIDEDVMMDLVEAVCDEILKDNELEDILVRIEDTGLYKDGEFVDKFYERVNDILDNIDKMKFNELSLEVYVDGAGDIVAQHVFDADSKLVAAYQYVIADDKSFGFEIGTYRNDELRKGFAVTGEYNGGKVTGTFENYRSGSPRSSIEFQDVNVRKLLSGNPSGKLEYSLATFTGMSSLRDYDLIVDFDLSVKSSKANIEIKENDKTLVTADLTLKKSSASKIKAPSKTVDISSSTDIKDFLEDLDFDKMLDNCEAAEMPDAYTRVIEKLTRNGISLDSLTGMLPSSLRKKLR
ncbi:MAG: zinc ribbon domain-containing protein [Lachnospiraceae bacterium]|nr:zinc ribbon domain-containing protein [Lachnospiraceae bacterium]